MTEKKTGKLILDSIPNEEAEKAVIAYLERLLRKYPTGKITALVQKAPVTLSSSIPADKGMIIAEKLRELGASAVFTVDENLDNEEKCSPVEPAKNPVVLKQATKISESKTVKDKGKVNTRQWLKTAIASLLLIGAAVFGYIRFLEIKAIYSPEINPSQNFQSHSPTHVNYTEFNSLSPISFQSPSFKKVAPQNMYEAFLYQYRMRPDTRFIHAFHLLIERFSQLHYSDPGMSPFGIGTIQSDGKNIYIPLLKNGEPVTEISLGLPMRFSDIQYGLSRCIDFMDEKRNFKNIKLVYDLDRNETLQKAEQCIDMADPRFVSVGLSVLEDLWQKGQRDPYILKTTAKAYTMLLMVLKPDRMGYIDTFASEALVFLALARYLNPEILTDREEFLLATNMGYRSHADSIKENLVQTSIRKEDRILDAYARQDSKGLKALCKDAPGILGHYLLSRHYREVGLHHEAKAAANELLYLFPTSYLSMFENINSGPLHLAKILTILYPLDLLRFIESKVSPDRLNDLAPWIERIEGFSGDAVTSGISLTGFDRMLVNWSPYDNESDYRFIIDEKRLKRIFRSLYASAVYARFEVLFSRWAVIEKAKTYVDSLAVDDKEHPMVLYMQGLVFAQLGKQDEADNIFSKIIGSPDLCSHLAYYAFYGLDDIVHKLRYLPVVANRIDGRPSNRLLMGFLFQNSIYNYDLSARYYESGLSQDPYQYWAYTYLSYVKGNTGPLLAALERSPYSYQLLIEAGKYFANNNDPKSLEKAAYLYELAQELAPSKLSIALDHARVLRKLQRYNEALEVLNTWLDHYGGNDLDTTITKSHRAYIYLQMGQPEKALASLGRDIESYQAGVIMNVARAYEDMGQITKAAMQYQKVLKRYPTVDHVIASAAGFFWRQGEFELAAQMIAMGRPSQSSFSRWYFEDFTDVFRKATNDEIFRAAKLLEENGASSWELRALGWKLAKEQKKEAAFKIMSTLKEKKKMLSLENTISAYKLLIQWKGRDSAKEFLRKTISKNDRGPMMMVLYKHGLFDTILDEIGDPDDYGPKYREFMWLQMLIAWLACDKQPADLESQLSSHYQMKSSDYYHAIGSYMLGQKPLEYLLGKIQSPKQQCEFAYYIGLNERLKGDFKEATQWYHLCRETTLSNNGEFHWASDELFWWAHMGIENRHRLVSKDIETYRTNKLSENFVSL